VYALFLQKRKKRVTPQNVDAQIPAFTTTIFGAKVAAKWVILGS
jgi:hypothetical protein